MGGWWPDPGAQGSGSATKRVAWGEVWGLLRGHRGEAGRGARGEVREVRFPSEGRNWFYNIIIIIFPRRKKKKNKPDFLEKESDFLRELSCSEKVCFCSSSPAARERGQEPGRAVGVQRRFWEICNGESWRDPGQVRPHARFQRRLPPGRRTPLREAASPPSSGSGAAGLGQGPPPAGQPRLLGAGAGGGGAAARLCRGTPPPSPVIPARVPGVGRPRRAAPPPRC